MRIAIVGTGYVGLVVGACLADSGSDVVCVDVDERKLERLRRGDVPFFEPGLTDLVRRNRPARLRFSSDLPGSIEGRSVVFIAVGTPPNEDGSADLTHVLEVATSVAHSARNDLVLVLKSTVPVGTNDAVRAVVRGAGPRIAVVSNPEFLKEGDAVNDFLKPDRIVVGTDDDGAFEILRRLYAPFNRQRNRVLRMSPKSAEIVKYAANALLATKISFINDIARLCDAAGGDVEHVRIALGADRRIGAPFLYPGLGFGGSCFPKDLRALAKVGRDLGVPLQVVEAAIAANELPVVDMLERIETDLGGVEGKTIAVWGLAFKPKTDDVRESAALKMVRGLIERGAAVRASDPQAIETARASLEAEPRSSAVSYFPDEYEACRGADALVLCTEWNEYRAPDARRLRSLLRGEHVFDGRNVMVGPELVEAGLVYRGVGRGARRG